MKTGSIISISLLLVCSTVAGQLPDSLKYVSLNPSDFQKTFQNDKKAVLIDVREFFEFKKSRIDNAVNIPSSANLDITADTLKKGLTLYLYCTTGYRSKRVAKHFYDMGFVKLYNLEGGIKKWKEDGLPVNRKKIRKSH